MTYWKDSLLVGVPQIDNQHRKLVSAIDRLMEACTQGKGRSIIEETLFFVVSYTKDHFRDEEKLQAQYEYPYMPAHKLLHAGFIRDINTIVREFGRTGPNVALTGKVNKTLADWLINHINIEDKKLGEYINNSKAGSK